MTLLQKVLLALGFFPMLLRTFPATQATHTVTGVVVHKDTGKPIRNVYLYVVKGEEEALTDSKGAFRLNTGKGLPLTLHVVYPAGGNIRVVVSNADKPIRILL